MEGALQNISYVVRRTLDDVQQRGTKILIWASVVTVVGLTVTGTFLFFLHEPDPAWLSYVPELGNKPATSPSTGMEEIHGVFADAAGVIALIGGGWFVYRVVHGVPRAITATLLLVIATHVTGALTRFNVVRLRGRELDDVERGYLQVFGGDMELMVTDRWNLGAGAARTFVVLHLVALPVILWYGWRSVTRYAAGEVELAKQSPYVGYIDRRRSQG